MSEPASRDRILDAALALFARDGASAPSLRRIGAETGLHNSSLFHHFRGKDAIHDALGERVIAAAAARLAPIARDGPPALADLIDALGDLAEHWAAHPEEANFVASVLLCGEEGALAGARARAERALLEPVWRWLVRARDAGEIRRVQPRAATLQLLGLVLLEPALGGGGGPAGLRPAAHARRRELDAWVRGALTK
jgi:AcrR family transcriptional regulator